MHSFILRQTWLTWHAVSLVSVSDVISVNQIFISTLTDLVSSLNEGFVRQTQTISLLSNSLKELAR